MLKKASLQKSNNKYQIDFDVYGEFARRKQRGVGFIDKSSISAMGQYESNASGMSETEIQGIHEFVYKKYGSEFEDILRLSAQEQRLCLTLY
jgi:hypothetical protein